MLFITAIRILVLLVVLYGAWKLWWYWFPSKNNVKGEDKGQKKSRSLRRKEEMLKDELSNNVNLRKELKVTKELFSTEDEVVEKQDKLKKLEKGR